MNLGRKRIIREVIADAENLSKYDLGETVRGLASRISMKDSEILKLNSNENLFIPLDFLRNILRRVVDEIDPRIYPRDEVNDLKNALSKHFSVSPEEIVVGTGSDQIIDLVSRMFLRRGDEALSIAPTFVIYEHCVKMQGAEYKSVLLKDDFSLDVEALLSSVTPNTRVIFLCSPNNPTANQFSHKDILSIAENFDGLVAVDEAYADFAGATILDLARDLENLIVFRTFSKVFGLAGLRVGYAITSRKLAEIINEKFQMPYSVCLMALRVATKLLEENFEFIKRKIFELRAERSRLINALNSMGRIVAFPSETNFVLFRTGNVDSSVVYKALLERGIIVRDIGQVLKFRNCLRVTVAPAQMMKRFIKELGVVLDEFGA
ncbi:MAG: histidinol-phosphate transaminase [Candidatus Bathyarchaeia archaeon]|nr:histidinol-phosphate transaminase [Candidatus Bathyarchaeota archaeon]